MTTFSGALGTLFLVMAQCYARDRSQVKNYTATTHAIYMVLYFLNYTAVTLTN